MDTTLLTDSVFVRVRYLSLHLQTCSQADHLKKLVAIVGAYMVASSKEMAQYIVLKVKALSLNIYWSFAAR